MVYNNNNNNNNNNNIMMGMGEDRISELSDAILLHILSFLPIDCVVSTSILSKRWRYLWTSIPVLDFRGLPFHHGDDDEDYNEDIWRLGTERFMTFVDKMFWSLDNGSTIKKFYLEYDEAFDESRVSAWITTVIRRKVEEINLSIRTELFQLPDCFYTCQSLTMLTLRTYATFYLPESISFPRLKILQLENILFVDENLTQQFFSNCPVLEELILTHCSWDMSVVSISAPALKFLYITGRGFYDDVGLSNCMVKVCASSLLSFRYWDVSAKDYVLRSFSSLVDANIDLDFFNPLKREEIGYGAIKLLGGLSNVKLLKMSGATFEALSFADDLLTNLPTFHNLIHLDVRSRFPPSTDRTILDFLQISPNLESIVFAQSFDDLSSDDDSCKPDLVHQCSLLQLKSVEFQEFVGNPRELNVVKLFLENARVLERMTIIFRKKKIEEIMEQLLMFPRGSASCVINFLNLLDMF